MSNLVAQDGDRASVAPSPVSIVVMGTQGVGKTTIGTLLAQKLGVPFIDGDRLHPASNVELMASGHALTDENRVPWLHIVGQTLVDHAVTGGVVIACSALKRRYRDLLREHSPTAYIVEPWGPIELVQARVQTRIHEYMPPTLLASQYETLEPLAADERGIRVSAEPTPAQIVATILEQYQHTRVRQEQQ